MSRESVFDNMGNGFFSLDILQEPEVHEDQLKKWDLKYLGVLTVDGKKIITILKVKS